MACTVEIGMVEGDEWLEGSLGALYEPFARGVRTFFFPASGRRLADRVVTCCATSTFLTSNERVAVRTATSDRRPIPSGLKIVFSVGKIPPAWESAVPVPAGTVHPAPTFVVNHPAASNRAVAAAPGAFFPPAMPGGSLAGRWSMA